MGKNKAELSVEDRLVLDINDLKRDLRDIKTRQRIGGDNTIVEGSNLFSSSASIANGQTVVFTLTYTPDEELLGLTNLAITFYVGTELDLNYALPDGGSLSTDQRAYDIQMYQDWGRSSDAIGRKVWRIRVQSNTVFGPYTVHIYGKVYAIKNPASV
jgi:hypothetical protein